MKKLLFLVTALLAMVQQSSAQTITVADVQTLPGETAAFSLNLTGGKVDQYTALQFDVQFPATGFTTTGDYTVNTSSWKGVSCTVGDVDATTGLATIPFASANAITAADVENLVSVSFLVDSEVAVGEYDVTLKNISLSYGFSSKDYPADVTFKVKVVDRIAFDETATVLPFYTAGNKANVSMKRTIKAGEWSTIVLPFTLSQTQAKTAFGDDVELAVFNGFVVDYGDNEENVVPLGITINLNTYTMGTKKPMTGGKPFLIKTSTDIESFEADDVTLCAAVTDVVETDEFDTSGKMTGTLVKSVIPADGLFISDNKFWYSTGNTNVKAFRCWFELGAVLDKETDFGARVFLNFEDEGTTGIINHSKTTDNISWYTLDGRKLDKKPTAKGVYVRDGRKVVIK